MVLNGYKTKVMLFNSGIKWDFMPQIFNGRGENLEVVLEMKILGIIL